jgi:hypothetical protein
MLQEMVAQHMQLHLELEHRPLAPTLHARNPIFHPAHRRH